MTPEWAGLWVAHAKLRWGAVVLAPGDIFEFDEGDLEAGADPAFLLGIGAIERVPTPAEAETPAETPPETPAEPAPRPGRRAAKAVSDG